MPKPIPVFAFIFAAYAATLDLSASSEPSLPRVRASATPDPFLAVWRALARRRRGLRVKVLAERIPANSGLPLSQRKEAGGGEDVWLRDIHQTDFGFCGVVEKRSKRSRGPQTGQSVEFTSADVLDWTIFAAASSPSPKNPFE